MLILEAAKFLSDIQRQILEAATYLERQTTFFLAITRR